MNDLNEQQSEAVNYGSGPLLVLAGAGSGKTKVLVHRVAQIIKSKKALSNEIALLTFTNKAAEEMKRRIKTLIGSEIELGFVGTFHSFCVKLIREFGHLIGIPRNFLVLDSDDSESAMKEVFKLLRIEKDEANPRMYLSIIGKMKNDLIGRRDMMDTKNNPFYRKVADAWLKYEETLQRNKSLDFDDLLVKTVQLLEINTVRKEINERLQWILVDEYQDTNKAQFELTKLIAGERKNLTVVGDASQAIYSFRGADFRNLSLLEEEYSEIGRITLPKNYRSTQNILDGAYDVVSNNTTHPTTKLLSLGSSGERIKMVESEDEKAEARKIVQIAASESQLSQVAILYRVNSLSRAIEEELIRSGLTYRLIGGVRFYGRAEIKDLLAYLKLVVNPEDEISKKRIEKVGKRKMRTFFDWLSKQSSDKRHNNTSEIIEEIIQETKYLDRFDKHSQDDESKVENIRELLAVATEYNDPIKFLESAALAESESRRDQANSKITLMTIHAAKGLEFETVIVSGLEEGLFPHSRSINLGSKDEIEEERRLMYVAMTRAKSKLYLSFCRSRLVFGGRSRTIPSRFLSEIKDSLLEKTDKDTIKIKQEDQKPERRIVEDWEIERETKEDFADVDNW